MLTSSTFVAMFVDVSGLYSCPLSLTPPCKASGWPLTGETAVHQHDTRPVWVDEKSQKHGGRFSGIRLENDKPGKYTRVKYFSRSDPFKCLALRNSSSYSVVRCLIWFLLRQIPAGGFAVTSGWRWTEARGRCLSRHRGPSGDGTACRRVNLSSPCPALTKWQSESDCWTAFL